MIQVACAYYFHSRLELMDRTRQPPGDEDRGGDPDRQGKQDDQRQQALLRLQDLLKSGVGPLQTVRAAAP